MGDVNVENVQMMAWQLKYQKALESQQAFEQLIDLLQQYNDRTEKNEKNESENCDELVLSILTVRNQCFDVPTFFAHIEPFDTYFHGINTDWFFYSTANIKWARAKQSNDTILLDEFPSTIFPIDPLRVITIVPRIIIDQVLGIAHGTIVPTIINNQKNPIINSNNATKATIDIVIDQFEK